MENQTAVGMNRTGLDMAPLARDEMIGYAQAEAARAPESDGSFEAVHIAYVASAAGHQDLADGFAEALKQENEHLAPVRGWLRAAVLQEAT